MQGEAQATLSCAFFRPHLQAARSFRDKSVVETRALATVSCGFVFTAFPKHVEMRALPLRPLGQLDASTTAMI